MHSTKSILALGLIGLTIAVVYMAQPSAAQGAGPFGASRPASGIFEPTMSFIRQNMRLMNSYVALMRSIFVGSFERPLITSTDAPHSGATRGPSPVVPPMDLPRSRRH